METLLNLLGNQTVFKIGDASGVSAVRRAGNELSKKAGFDETRSGQLALIITEAATNILKHAGHGEILLRLVNSGDLAGVEVIAIDAGPGINNPSKSMEDGNSSSGTYGVGLGAIRRLAHEFDIFTMPGSGTILMMLLWTSPQVINQCWQLGAVCLPFPGEEAYGDAWKVIADGSGLTAIVADGLGHGPEAAVASSTAVELAHMQGLPEQMLAKAHGALRGTRGAAVAIIRIHLESAGLYFIGLGNIAGCLLDGDSRQHLMSHNGIVGSNFHKAQQFQFPWSHSSTLILHSDGLATRWDLERYPGLAYCHPCLIAAVLYRDFSRGRDDVIVLVIKNGRGRG